MHNTGIFVENNFQLKTQYFHHLCKNINITLYIGVLTQNEGAD